MSKQAILALMNDDLETRRSAIIDFIKDESNSYEDRREVWLATPDHLFTKDPWVLHLNEFDRKYGEISWYDDFGGERYSEVDLVSSVCDVLEEAEDPEYEWDGYFKSREMVEDFIAACIKKGVHSFNYDW